MSYPELKLLIDGEWRTRSGEPVINPADESVLGTVPHATRADLDDALSSAERGFLVWRALSPNKRCEIMQRAAALVRSRVDSIATSITLEQGKPLAQSRAEVLRACDIIEWDAQEGRRTYGRVIPSEPGMRHTVLRQPVGIVFAISSWNFPIATPARKIAGALAAGCAIILKASEETPAGALLLAQAFTEAGVPPGALNIVYGVPSEISNYLIPQPSIRMLTFTGSIPVGKHLAAMAGQHMKPALMELGGHAPVIVCGDADPVKAAAISVTGKLRNAGQVCVSPTRFFVEDKVFDRFTEHFVEKARTVRMGSGLDPQTQLGPLANLRRVEAIDALVADADKRGAKIQSGGKREGNRGFFYPLTVITDTSDEVQAMQQEPFGPIALINRVPDLDAAIKKANALPYGLAGYVFTHSAENAERLAAEVEVGNLAINHFTASVAETPFGGVKDSGYGREGGIEGISCFTVTKNISHLFS